MSFHAKSSATNAITLHAYFREYKLFEMGRTTPAMKLDGK